MNLVLLVLSASAVAVQGVPDWDVHGSQVNPAESNRTYTSKWDNDVYYERSELNSAAAWIPCHTDDCGLIAGSSAPQWMQIDLGTSLWVSGVFTQPMAGYPIYRATSIKVQVSDTVCDANTAFVNNTAGDSLFTTFTSPVCSDNCAACDLQHCVTTGPGCSWDEPNNECTVQGGGGAPPVNQNDVKYSNFVTTQGQYVCIWPTVGASTVYTTALRAAVMTCNLATGCDAPTCGAGYFGTPGACTACDSITNATEVTCTAAGNSQVSACAAGHYKYVNVCVAHTNVATCTGHQVSGVAQKVVGTPTADASCTACAATTFGPADGSANCTAMTDVTACTGNQAGATGSSTVAEACWDLDVYANNVCGGTTLETCWDAAGDTVYTCSEFAACGVNCGARKVDGTPTADASCEACAATTFGPADGSASCTAHTNVATTCTGYNSTNVARLVAGSATVDTSCAACAAGFQAATSADNCTVIPDIGSASAQSPFAATLAMIVVVLASSLKYL